MQTLRSIIISTIRVFLYRVVRDAPVVQKGHKHWPDEPAVGYDEENPTQRTDKSLPAHLWARTKSRLCWSRTMQTTLNAAIDSYLRMRPRSRGTRNEYHSHSLVKRLQKVGHKVTLEAVA